MTKIAVKIATLSIFLVFIITSFAASGINLSETYESNITDILNYEIDYKVPLTAKDITILKKRAQLEGWSFEVGETSATKLHTNQLCGFIAPSNIDLNSNSENYGTLRSSDGLPENFDWRDPQGHKGANWNCITSVKDQDDPYPCGSCWAFPVIASLESNILIKYNKTVDLSEQWLVSCNRETLDNGKPWGCDGGNFTANDYLSGEKKGKCGGYGAVLESDFPYVAHNAPCNGPYNHPYAIDSWSYIGKNLLPAVDEIKQAIYEYGPVSAAVYVDNYFQSYTKGVFNITSCPEPNPGKVNHAIFIVGWDDNYTYEDDEHGVWIIKNSWGTGWGENGYMYIGYDCYHVGVASNYITFSGRSGSSNQTNNPPIVSNENPANNDLSVPLDINSVSINISDEEDDLFNWSIETSPNIGNKSSNDDSNGVKICNVQGLKPNTEYIWYVNVTDYNGSGNLTRRKFTFKTESPPEEPYDPDPKNNQINVPLTPILFVKVYDPNNDLMNVSFYWSDNTLIGIDYNVDNIDRWAVCSIDKDLEYNTTYSWYVIAEDGKYQTKSKTWNFTTWSEEYKESILDISFPIFSLASVRTKIKNICEENILDANWSINIKGGFLGRINISKGGLIDIDSGETTIISTWGLRLKDRIVRRFGSVDVLLNVEVYGTNFTKSAKGFVLGRAVFLFGN